MKTEWIVTISLVSVIVVLLIVILIFIIYSRTRDSTLFRLEKNKSKGCSNCQKVSTDDDESKQNIIYTNNPYRPEPDEVASSSAVTITVDDADEKRFRITPNNSAFTYRLYDRNGGKGPTTVLVPTGFYSANELAAELERVLRESGVDGSAMYNAESGNFMVNIGGGTAWDLCPMPLRVAGVGMIYDTIGFTNIPKRCGRGSTLFASAIAGDRV
jgi:hypothetical protein